MQLAADTAYMQFVAEWGRSIGTIEEYEFRRDLFMITDSIIAEHNATKSSWKLGHNYMSDWTEDEKARMRGYKGQPSENKNYVELDTSALPDEVDWVTKGAVTPVKDQKSCGSCWAFSTTGGMEGGHWKDTGKLLSFSEQQLVDCSKQNHGCGGGLMDKAYAFYKTESTILEADYPYTAKNGTCTETSKKLTGVKAASYTDVKPKSSDALKAAIAQQPVSVAIEADKAMFHYYASGILDTPNCGNHLDHGVLAVGYGMDSNYNPPVAYYLVKNSWNTTWGDKGFIKMAIRDGEGTCGIQMQPSWPTTN